MIKTVDNIKRFYNLTSVSMDNALSRMAKDVMLNAKIRVPYKEGDLQETIKPKRISLMHHRVEAGGGKVVYAIYQEMGMRKDGSHVVRRYTTPNTGKHYLKDAGDKAEKNVVNYLKQAVLRKI